jgi:hypothetical protein
MGCNTRNDCCLPAPELSVALLAWQLLDARVGLSASVAPAHFQLQLEPPPKVVLPHFQLQPQPQLPNPRIVGPLPDPANEPGSGAARPDTGGGGAPP